VLQGIIDVHDELSFRPGWLTVTPGFQMSTLIQGPQKFRFLPPPHESGPGLEHYVGPADAELRAPGPNIIETRGLLTKLWDRRINLLLGLWLRLKIFDFVAELFNLHNSYLIFYLFIGSPTRSSRACNFRQNTFLKLEREVKRRNLMLMFRFVFLRCFRTYCVELDSL
jgi:hypothetical protein